MILLFALLCHILFFLIVDLVHDALVIQNSIEVVDEIPFSGNIQHMNK